MANARIKQLEIAVAHYEDIMSRCPQCKTALPVLEATPAPQPSEQALLPRSRRRAAAELFPPPKQTKPRPLQAKTKASTTRSSKKPATATEPDAQDSDEQQYTSSLSERQSPDSSRQVAPTLPPPLSASIEGSPRPNMNTLTLPATESWRPSRFSSKSRPPTPPPNDLRFAVERSKHGGELINIALQGSYKSGTHRNIGRGGVTRSGEWVRSAELMMKDIPLGQDWQETLSKRDGSILAAVVMNSALTTERVVSPQNEDGKTEQLVRLVRGFARRHSEGRIIFEQFILVCMCSVLSDRKVPQDEIVQTLQICISDTGRTNVLRYLRGCVWVNELINDLFFTEWGYRAVDLIVLWNRPISTYAKIASPPNSYQYFISHLTQTAFHDGYHELPSRIYDTIPWIVKKELKDEVSYASICRALGYSEEYFMKTRHLHSSNFSDQGFSADDDSDDADRTLRSSSFQTAQQSMSSAPSRRRPTSADKSRSGPSSNASYLSDTSPRRRHLSDDDSPDDAAGSGPPPGQGSASERTKRMMPDRSAKPLGDPDVVRRREPRYVDPDTGELLVATSLGAGAPGTGSTKRPLPDSPTSPLQPDDNARRRRAAGDSLSREEMSSSSRSRKKDSHKQRSRA